MDTSNGIGDPQVSAAARPYQILVVSIYEFYLLSSTYLLYRNRSNHSIKVRGTGLIIAQTMLTMLMTPALVLETSFNGIYPCFIIFWAFVFGLPCWIVLFLGRGLRFRNLYNFHHFATKEYNKKIPKGTSETNRPSACRLSRKGKKYPPSEPAFASIPVPVPLESGVLHFEEGAWQFISRSKVVDKRLTRGIFLFAFLLLVYCLVLQSTSPYISWNPMKRGSECNFEQWIYLPSFAFAGFFACILAPTMVIMLSKVQDTQGIQVDLLFTAVSTALCIVIYFLWQYDIIPSFLDWGIVGPSHLTYILLGTNHVTSVIFPLLKLIPARKEKESSSSLIMNLDSFQKVLSDKDLFELLKQTATKDLCSEQVIFLEEVSLLKKKASFVDEGSTSKLERTSTERTRRPSTKSVAQSNYEEQSINLSPIDSEAEAEFPLPLKPISENINTPAVSSNEPVSSRRSRYDYNLHQQRTTVVNIPNDDTTRRQSQVSRITTQSDTQHPVTMQEKSPSIKSSSSNLDSVTTKHKRMLRRRTSTELQALALHCGKLVEAFINVDSPLELNISADARTNIIDKYNNHQITTDMFDEAREEIILQLFLNTYPKMVKAQTGRRVA